MKIKSHVRNSHSEELIEEKRKEKKKKNRAST